MRRSLDQFTQFALRMAQMNPKGFRDPRTSRKRANASERMPTLFEQLAIEGGHDPDWQPREPSGRGQRKRKQRRLARERMKAADVLRDQYRSIPGHNKFAKAAPKGWKP